MSSPETEKCLNNPKFKELTRARANGNILFSLIILVGYGIYVLGISFAPKLMSSPVTSGSSLTYGILIAVLVIVSGMVCSGLYVWWANRKFDVLKQDLLKDLGHE
ncbi:hypothetical protein MNBD_ALPHA02-1579 [hydrothermal vent metagenome]|uniref:DUF485 domain-containing protein n=1 Tax=hydrothermal vent metagenome TaxID=652676 RepID=A0A3B0RPQ3_9ZZZZ